MHGKAPAHWPYASTTSRALSSLSQWPEVSRQLNSHFLSDEKKNPSLSIQLSTSRMMCIDSFGSMAKHLPSVMMLCVMASNGENMLLVWFIASYRLTAANYKDVLATNILRWERSWRKWTTSFSKMVPQPTQSRLCKNSWGLNMNLWSVFWLLQLPDFNPLDNSMWAHIAGKACKVHHNVDELKSINSMFNRKMWTSDLA